MGSRADEQTLSGDMGLGTCGKAEEPGLQRELVNLVGNNVQTGNIPTFYLYIHFIYKLMLVRADTFTLNDNIMLPGSLRVGSPKFRQQLSLDFTVFSSVESRSN